MTAQEEDRHITIGGKDYTLQPFTLRQLKEIGKMAGSMADPDKATEAGFTVMAMALSNVRPKIEGDLDDLPLEAAELQDIMTKVQKLAGFRVVAKEPAPAGEATAPTPGA